MSQRNITKSKVTLFPAVSVRYEPTPESLALLEDFKTEFWKFLDDPKWANLRVSAR